jgi:hypothetical protein
MSTVLLSFNSKLDESSPLLKKNPNKK